MNQAELATIRHHLTEAEYDGKMRDIYHDCPHGREARCVVMRHVKEMVQADAYMVSLVHKHESQRKRQRILVTPLTEFFNIDVRIVPEELRS